MFLTLGLKFQAWNLEIAFQILTLGLQFQVWNLKISFQIEKNSMFLIPGLQFQVLEPGNFIPKLGKHTFYRATCMFLTEGLQFQVWNLEISFQN